MNDERPLRNARISTVLFGAFHVWLLLLVLQDASGGTAPGKLLTFAIAVCLAPIIAAVLLWQDTPPEWVLVVNCGIGAFYGLAAFALGLLAFAFLGGPDRGNGFGGSDLEYLPHTVVYVVLAAAVVWTTGQSVVRAARKP